MVVLTESVRLKNNYTNKRIYGKLGYVFDDKVASVEVKVSDLHDRSHAYVELKCDICGKVENKRWWTVVHSRLYSDKDLCYECESTDWVFDKDKYVNHGDIERFHKHGMASYQYFVRRSDRLPYYTNYFDDSSVDHSVFTEVIDLTWDPEKFYDKPYSKRYFKGDVYELYGSGADGIVADNGLLLTPSTSLMKKNGEKKYLHFKERANSNGSNAYYDYETDVLKVSHNTLEVTSLSNGDLIVGFSGMGIMNDSRNTMAYEAFEKLLNAIRASRHKGFYNDIDDRVTKNYDLDLRHVRNKYEE